MTFYRQNYLDTSTMIAVNNGTSSASNLYDRDSDSYYLSVGDNDDATTSTIAIELDSTVTVDRIILEGINFKGFRVYYNSNSANLITLDDNLTTTSEWVTNSVTNMYLKFNSATAIKSVFIEATTTMVANEEKKIYECWITELKQEFDYNPSSKNYKPKLKRKEYAHKMSDGGTSVSVIAKGRFEATIKRKFVTETERDNLKTLYDLWEPLVFIPEPTGTSWNAEVYEINWVGDFDFYTFASDFKGNGFSGKMKIKESAK